MASKTTQDFDFQVLFLIDLNPSFWRPRYSAKDATSAVVLCALKVLSYFNDYGRRQLSTLRWGYQFFSSKTLSHHIERREFKEFATVVFEEFENDVSKMFNDCFSQNHTTDREEACTKPPAGAKNISCAFANATHDFQWDGPDTSSPLTSRQTPRNIINRKIRNIVFLLSDCPCDDASIEEFTGESLSALISLEGLKNILIPSVLHKELKKHDICLQWVSTGDVQWGKNASFRLLLGGILKEFGGFIIPLSSICYSSICQNNLTPKEIRCSFYGSLLPFKSVMDSYCARRTQALVDMIDRGENHLCNKPFCLGMRGLLCSSGAELKVHCSVWLTSIFQSATMQCRPSNVQYACTLADRVPKASGLETTEIPSCPVFLWIQGVIRHKYICPSWLHPVKAYLCFASNCKMTDTDSLLCPKEFLSGWFQEMLLTLAKDGKSLVIDVIDCETGLPVCGILQPLTSVCGVISIVTSECLWKFEKCLLEDGRIAMLDWRNIRREKSPLDFFADLARGPLPEATLQLTSTEVFSSVIGSQNALQASTQTREFRPALLDPWCLPPEVGEDDELFWGELARSWTPLNGCKPEDDDVGCAATLMGDLKSLYKSKNTKPVVKRKQGNWKKIPTSRGIMKTSGNEIIDSSQGSKNVVYQNKRNLVLMNARNECLGKRTNEGTIDNETVNLARHAEDEASLTRAVQSMCSKVIFEGANICSEITNIMMSVTNFYKKDISKREKDYVSQFIIQNLLVPLVELREKYEGSIAADIKGHQLKEYQLQVLLRTEIATFTKSDEKSALVQEVTDLLRAISFMKDPNFLAVFLREVLLNRYCHCLPKFLCSIYEGLMICPPKEVLTPSKCSAVDESPMRRSASVISNQPRLSSECCVFTRHLSAKDVPTKRREIFVPLKSKQKENGKKKKAELPQFVSAKAVSMNTRGKKEPAKLVRRNLFTGIERAMENDLTDRRELQKREVSDTARKTHSGREFGRRNTTGAMPRAAVQETPARKQVPHALWNKQDRARRRSQAHTDAFVLKESPMKELPTGESFCWRHPQRSSEIMFQRSQSFYGGSTSRDPLTGPKSSSGVEIGSLSTAEPTEYSQSEQTSCATGRQSLSDVSLLRFPPQHKKKFSLHGLLNATKGHDSQKNEMLQEHPNVSFHAGGNFSTKSSARILRKRSFSCIGFSSVPFPEVQQECEYQCSQTGPVVTTKSNSPKVSFEKVVPEVDECIEEPQPLQIRFKSPAEDSSTGLPKTVLCSGGCPPPCGIESPCDTDNNLESISYSETSVILKAGNTNVTRSLTKTSPCSFRLDLNDQNSIATRQHLGECVVVLTPIKGPLTSPVHLKSQDTSSSLAVVGTKRDIATVASPNFVSLRFSPPFSPQIKDKRKTGTFCGSPSETKRSSPLNHILRQQKRKRHLASSPVANKCCKKDISVQISDFASEEWSKNNQQRKDITEPSSLNVAHPTSEGDNLGSSQDIEFWLTERQKEIALFIADENNVFTSPPVKKRRIQKYAVFSEKSSGDDSKTRGESCSLHRDTSFEGDDEVFRSPSSLRRRCAKKTILSASSIKILQESPLLCGTQTLSSNS